MDLTNKHLTGLVLTKKYDTYLFRLAGVTVVSSVVRTLHSNSSPYGNLPKCF